MSQQQQQPTHTLHDEMVSAQDTHTNGVPLLRAEVEKKNELSNVFAI